MKTLLITNGITFLLLIISGAAIYFLIKLLKKRKEQIEELNNTVQQLKENIDVLITYTKDIDKIKKQEKEIQKEIKNAETDEEIFNIVNSIIHRNNELCNN